MDYQGISTHEDAEKFELKLKLKKLEGVNVTNASSQITVDQFFERWFEQVKHTASAGWRREQAKRYGTYVKPVIGGRRLNTVTPAMALEVINGVRRRGFTERTALHVYAFLHKLFGDAVELFNCLDRSPVTRALRPRPPEKEAPHLTVEQAVKLLRHVEGKPYELAVWVGVFLGLRAGEVQALTWDNVDLEKGVLHIRAAFVRKEGIIRDYPKGKKWHSHKMPPELLGKLKLAKTVSTSRFVVTSPRREMLNYWGYRAALRRYCVEAKVPNIAAHGLRHSTAAIYMAHGASRDDLQRLFRHSSSAVTDLYIHETNESVDRVAKVIQLFSDRKGQKADQEELASPCSTKCSTLPENPVTKSS